MAALGGGGLVGTEPGPPPPPPPPERRMANDLLLSEVTDSVHRVPSRQGIPGSSTADRRRLDRQPKRTSE